MGSQSWGAVRIPTWALRYPKIKSLIDEYGDSTENHGECGEYRFASGVLVYNDVFPAKIHQTLQRLDVPYNFAYTLEAFEAGEQSGGWRPGMANPLEFTSSEGERTFTASQLRKILIGEGSPRKRLGELRARLEEEARLLTPLAEWPDPRAVHARTLRAAALRAASKRPVPAPRRRRPGL